METLIPFFSAIQIPPTSHSLGNQLNGNCRCPVADLGYHLGGDFPLAGKPIEWKHLGNEGLRLLVCNFPLAGKPIEWKPAVMFTTALRAAAASHSLGNQLNGNT